MKLRLALVAMTAISFAACTKKADLKSDLGKASYAIGQQIGQNLKSQNIDFDADTLAAALKDAREGKNQMTKEQIQEAMMKIQELAMKKQGEEAEKNKKASQEFLDKNKSAEGVKATASGLQYKVEKEGDGATPTKEDTVKVHYKGTLISGEQFDSSYDRGQPAEFPVNAVIRLDRSSSVDEGGFKIQIIHSTRYRLRTFRPSWDSTKFNFDF